MQSNSDKQDYTKQDNNYSLEGAYSSYQAAPPSYSVYSQQPIDGAGYTATGTPYISQAPLNQQKRIVVAPIRRQVVNRRVAIPITNRLKVFLLLSGFIYFLWGILSFSFQIAIVVNSYSTYYHGFWTGAFCIVGGILTMIVGLQSSYPLAQLMRMYIVYLTLCAIGLVFSVANYAVSNRCRSISTWYCDDSLASNLKIGLVIIFSLATIHSVFNIIYISKEQKKAISISNPNVLNY